MVYKHDIFARPNDTESSCKFVALAQMIYLLWNETISSKWKNFRGLIEESKLTIVFDSMQNQRT